MVATKVITSLGFVVVLGAFWAWMNLRVHVLRKAGAMDFARRQRQRNAIIFGGMLVVLVAITWIPRNVRGWGALLGLVAIVGGIGVLFVPDVRQVLRRRRQPRSRQETDHADS